MLSDADRKQLSRMAAAASVLGLGLVLGLTGLIVWAWFF